MDKIRTIEEMFSLTFWLPMGTLLYVLIFKGPFGFTCVCFSEACVG